MALKQPPRREWLRKWIREMGMAAFVGDLLGRVWQREGYGSGFLAQPLPLYKFRDVCKAG